MCDMCDGASLEDVLSSMRSRVERYGFTAQYVETAPQWGWGYTVGLLERVGHPELTVVDAPLDRVHKVLVELGERVVAGERFDAGDRARVSGATLLIGHVHAAHHQRGLFNFWWNYYRNLGAETGLDVVQVFLPEDSFCPVHGDRQPDLSLPDLAKFERAIAMSRHERRLERRRRDERRRSQRRRRAQRRRRSS